MNKTYIVEYVWVDGSGLEMRSKARTVIGVLNQYYDVPIWSYDGSSTGYASEYSSDVTLHPVAMYSDPFRGDINKIVLCEGYDSAGNPVGGNYRYLLSNAYETYSPYSPLFGIEQEYYVLYEYFNTELKSYCRAGSDACFGRHIADEHYRLCLQAGIEICGINGECGFGYWEFYLGPSTPLVCADDLMVARYILQRVGERNGIAITFKPKVHPDMPGSGLHTNYSDVYIRRRDEGVLHSALYQLKNKHEEHISVYGSNKERLTGLHETSDIDTFTYGISNRSASVRIPPTMTYLEDRRPAADANPYQVVYAIIETCILDTNCY